MADTSDKRRWRVWITLSELVGVLALVVAGLNFWDSHRDRTASERRAAAEQQGAAREAAARSAFVLTARSESDGARLALQPMSAAQAVQGERFIFPSELDVAPVHTVQAQLGRDAVEAGLRRVLAAQRKIGQAGRSGEAALPVGVVSSYVEAGEPRTDQSIYRLDYAWRTPFLGGPRFTLEGASLVRRSVRGDLQRAVNAAWRAEGVG